MEKRDYVLHFVLLCLFFLCCVSATTGNHHHKSISSTAGGLQITRTHVSLNRREILILDQERVRSMNTIDENGEGTNLPLFDRSSGAGNYLVTVSFGTPKSDYKLIFDTGSELTWVQCLPCLACYEQDGQRFDPATSSTFSIASCSHPSCEYYQLYNDKSYSAGYYGKDTLTISPSETFPNFVFGCGNNNSNTFGKAAGLLGLGGDTGISLMSQTSNGFAKIFCYCLPVSETSTGFLRFGIEALKTCQTNSFTPLLTDPKRPSSYFVSLIGISIGGQRLTISSQKYLLDSGTVISRLPSSVHSQLRSAFMNLMSMYPVADPVDRLLDTCYNLQGHYENFKPPKMVLYFDKISVDLEPEAVIWVVTESQVCLGFGGNKDETDLLIIGNHQMKKLNILFDINNKKVDISPGTCGN